jgi:YidC/Oxa1 family membrane protein insertase
MWDLLILSPMVNLLLLFYRLLGHQTVLAITALTLVVRLAVLPLTLKQQQSARRMQELQPELVKLQKKYADDREKLAQEQMKLYREAGINPLGGCLPLLIQLPLLYGLWQAIMRTLAVSPLELIRLSQNVYSFIPGMASLIPLQSRFLWMDLGQPDPYYVLPILVVVTSWLSQKILTPPSTDPQSAAMNQQMLIMMPLMFGFISISYASGLSIYFIISNLVTLLQYFVTPRPRAVPAGTVEVAKEPERPKEPERSPQPARRKRGRR